MFASVKPSAATLIRVAFSWVRVLYLNAIPKEKSHPYGDDFFFWWRQQDSNLWPHACEACALTSWAMPPWNRLHYSKVLMKCQEKDCGKMKCKMLCHCEGTCARGNLRCAFAHETKIEEKFTPEIPTPVGGTSSEWHDFGIVWSFCTLHFAFLLLLQTRCFSNFLAIFFMQHFPGFREKWRRFVRFFSAFLKN